MHASTLICLKCSFNELGDDGVAILLEPFSSCWNVLEELHLESNEIEVQGATALLRAQLPKLKELNVADNFDIPKRHLREKYGNAVNFGDDEDDEEEDDEEKDEDLDALISQFSESLKV